jgi:hypothetical protein
MSFIGYVAVGEVEVVAQDEHRTLTLGQPRQRLPHRVLLGAAGVLDRPIRHVADHGLGARAAALLRYVRIYDRPAGVREWCGDVQPVTEASVQRNEAFLDKILGLPAIATQDVGEPGQRDRVLRGERGERDICHGGEGRFHIDQDAMT